MSEQSDEIRKDILKERRDVGARRRNPERQHHARPRSGISPPSRLPVKPAMTTKAAGKYASQLTLCRRWPYIALIFGPRFKLIIYQGIIKEKRKQVVLLPSLSAVGETRTRTGLRPLPPQSSVSTISPPPLEFGIAKVRQKSKLPNFSSKIFQKK